MHISKIEDHVIIEGGRWREGDNYFNISMHPAYEAVNTRYQFYIQHANANTRWTGRGGGDTKMDAQRGRGARMGCCSNLLVFCTPTLMPINSSSTSFPSSVGVLTDPCFRNFAAILPLRKGLPSVLWGNTLAATVRHPIWNIQESGFKPATDVHPTATCVHPNSTPRAQTPVKKAG
jgi:hypothetical protein